MIQKPDLLKLSQWQPIAEDFGLDSETYTLKALPIYRTIEKLDRGEVRIMANGGLSNYASAFVHNRRNDSGNIQGLYIYLSLLAPIAAVGRDTAYITGKAQGYCMIEPASVLTYSDLDSPFEQSVWRVIEDAGFRFLSPSEANTLLPADVEPYEYCLNKEPWNRVFHVLFSDTD